MESHLLFCPPHYFQVLNPNAAGGEGGLPSVASHLHAQDALLPSSFSFFFLLSSHPPSILSVLFFPHILRSHYFLSSPHLLPLPLLLSLLHISFHLSTDFSSCVATALVLHLAQLRLVLSCSDSIATKITSASPSPRTLCILMCAGT